MLKPGNHNLVQLDHQEPMVSLVMMELMVVMVDLDHLVHQVHLDLLAVQVPEEAADPVAIWAHLAHPAMLAKLVFPV